MPRWLPVSIALFGGAILALMIAVNSTLAVFVTPIEASWLAHGTGALTAFGMLLLASKTQRYQQREAGKAPWWAYLGGLAGALLVALAVITVNSFLGITGTLVLSILGQVVFGLFSDQFGWFGLTAHPATRQKLLSIIPICLGAMLIVYAKGEML